MERKRLVKWSPIADAIANGSLTVTFLDDNSQMVFDLNAIPDATREQLFVNGVKQKIADCAANKDVDNKTAYGEMYARLVAGEYNAHREGGGSGPRMGVFPLAYQQFLAEQGIELDVEAVRAKIAEKTEQHKASGKPGSWRAAAEKNPRIAELMSVIEASRAKPTVALDDAALV